MRIQTDRQTDRQPRTCAVQGKCNCSQSINQHVTIRSLKCLSFYWFVLHVPLPYPPPPHPTPSIYRDVTDVTQPTECRCVVRSSHSSVRCAVEVKWRILHLADIAVFVRDIQKLKRPNSCPLSLSLCHQIRSDHISRKSDTSFILFFFSSFIYVSVIFVIIVNKDNYSCHQ